MHADRRVPRLYASDVSIRSDHRSFVRNRSKGRQVSARPRNRTSTRTYPLADSREGRGERLARRVRRDAFSQWQQGIRIPRESEDSPRPQPFPGLAIAFEGRHFDAMDHRSGRDVEEDANPPAGEADADVDIGSAAVPFACGDAGRIRREARAALADAFGV